MIHEMQPRPYTLRKRAQSRDETRQRIVEATIALHEEVGPRNTTISAIAERAGVQRLTVYRHFPDENAVFQACTSSWLEQHPLPPLPVLAEREQAGAAALRHGLLALYRYYRQNQGMLRASWRDAALVPALQAPMAELARYLDDYTAALATVFKGGTRWPQALRHTLSVATAFATWEQLAGLDVGDKAMADLTAQWAGG